MIQAFTSIQLDCCSDGSKVYHFIFIIILFIRKNSFGSLRPAVANFSGSDKQNASNNQTREEFQTPLTNTYSLEPNELIKFQFNPYTTAVDLVGPLSLFDKKITPMLSGFEI